MIYLNTKRTIIRDHCDEDLVTHHALFSDKTAMYYLQDIATNTMDESKVNLQNTMSEINKMNRKLYFLRMEDRYTQEHIGEIGYTVTALTPVGKFVEMGYFIRQKFWSKGYTSEALRELITDPICF